MKVSLPPRRVWLEWLKNVASAVIVTVAVAAGAVIAASESQQPTSGSAVALLCGASGAAGARCNRRLPSPGAPSRRPWRIRTLNKA